MLTPQFVLPIAGELVVDLFAGGGGASTGIEQATGRNVDLEAGRCSHVSARLHSCMAPWEAP